MKIDLEKTPIGGYSPGAIIARFCLAAFFGLFMDILMLFSMGRSQQFTSEAGFWYMLLLLPLIWGVIGIFWLGQILSATKGIFEACFGMDRRR